MLCPVKEQFANYRRHMEQVMGQKVQFSRLRLQQLEARVQRLSPESKLREKRMYVAKLEQKLDYFR